MGLNGAASGIASGDWASITGFTDTLRVESSANFKDSRRLHVPLFTNPKVKFMSRDMCDSCELLKRTPVSNLVWQTICIIFLTNMVIKSTSHTYMTCHRLGNYSMMIYILHKIW